MKYTETFPSDKQLAERINNGEESAFTQLYKKYFEKMVLVAVRYVKDSDTAKDVVQDSFIKLNIYLKSHKITGHLKGLIHLSVKRTGIEYWRRIRHFNDIDEDKGLLCINTQKEYEIKDEISFIQSYLEKSCPGMLKVLNLYHLGYTHKEIADMLGFSEGTSKSQLSHAKSHFKEVRSKLAS